MNRRIAMRRGQGKARTPAEFEIERARIGILGALVVAAEADRLEKRCSSVSEFLLALDNVITGLSASFTAKDDAQAEWWYGGKRDEKLKVTLNTGSTSISEESMVLQRDSLPAAVLIEIRSTMTIGGRPIERLSDLVEHPFRDCFNPRIIDKLETNGANPLTILNFEETPTFRWTEVRRNIAAGRPPLPERKS